MTTRVKASSSFLHGGAPCRGVQMNQQRREHIEKTIRTTWKSGPAYVAEVEALRSREAKFREALELMANGEPKTGQSTGPMKTYQYQAVARAALAAEVPHADQ